MKSMRRGVEEGRARNGGPKQLSRTVMDQTGTGQTEIGVQCRSLERYPDGPEDRGHPGSVRRLWDERATSIVVVEERNQTLG